MRLFILVLVLSTAVFPLLAGDCGTRCPRGEESFGFTIPVASIIEVLQFMGIEVPVGVPLVIPDIEVKLDTTFHGEASVSYPPGCCEGGRLVMGVDLLLMGTATLNSIPPSSTQFTSVVPVIRKLFDNAESFDANTIWCKKFLQNGAIRKRKRTSG